MRLNDGIISECEIWGSEASSEELASFELHDEHNIWSSCKCIRWVAVGDLVAGDGSVLTVGANQISWTIHVEMIRAIQAGWSITHILAITVDGTVGWALRFGGGVRVFVERNLGAVGSYIIESRPFDIEVKIPTVTNVTNRCSYRLRLAVSEVIAALWSTISHAVFKCHTQWICIAYCLALLNSLLWN